MRSSVVAALAAVAASFSTGVFRQQQRPFDLRSGGVPLEASDPVDALTCNCNAENVHIRWDFGGAWEAIILHGAKRGAKLTCDVSKLSEEKWQAVGATARYGTDFAIASPTEKKEASYLFLEEHMKGVMGQQERA